MPEWPSHVVAADDLAWDGSGRLLMVKTHNRASLVLPGGLVESGESPAAAGRREVLEEVGIEVSVGRLLAVQHLPAQDGKPSSVQFVFDSEPIAGSPVLTLQEDEIAAVHWLDPEESIARYGTRGQARLHAALRAHSGGSVEFLDATSTA